MKKIKVHVTLRESILDPTGSAVGENLQKLGYDSVQSVRIGKFIDIEANDDITEAQIDEMCEKLLANTVIEDYTYTIA